MSCSYPLDHVVMLLSPTLRWPTIYVHGYK